MCDPIKTLSIKLTHWLILLWLDLLKKQPQKKLKMFYQTQNKISIPIGWKRLPLGATVPSIAQYQYNGKWHSSSYQGKDGKVHEGLLRYIVLEDHSPVFAQIQRISEK